MLGLSLDTFIIGHKFCSTFQQNTKSTVYITIIARAGNRTRDISFEVKLFNCFYVMGRTINKQSLCGPHFFNNFVGFFCIILTFMDNYILQFLIFTGVEFTAEVWLKCKM